MLSRGSHQEIEVTCSFQLSEKCRGSWTTKYKDALRYREANEGKDICLPCSRRLKASGRSNPNCKYPDVDDNLFSTITLKEEAYILGLLASDGNFSGNVMKISMLKEDAHALLSSVAIFLNIAPPKLGSHGMCSITINSRQATQNALKWLKLSGIGPKSEFITLPSLSPELLDSFILGYFDGDGSVHFVEEQYNYPRVSIASSSHTFLKQVLAHYDIPGSCSLTSKCGNVEYAGANAVDFLGRIYAARPQFFLERKFLAFQRLCLWQPSLLGCSKSYPTFKCVKTSKDAVIPTKAHPSDSGYDLTILNEVKTVGEVTFYDTGLKVCPPDGFWLALVPRSSISKTGYMLANSLGIIDRTYTGPILVALRKIDQTASTLKLPCKVAQLVPLPAVHFEVEEVDQLTQTDRGANGFGSTNR